jgi:hypothetical protein
MGPPPAGDSQLRCIASVLREARKHASVHASSGFTPWIPRWISWKKRVAGWDAEVLFLSSRLMRVTRPSLDIWLRPAGCLL